MADSYPLPGRSIPGRADETPIREETAREALRGTEFDPDSELMNQMQDPREREIRNSLRLRGGMLLQDPDDDNVIDSGAVFEDSKGKTYNLEVGDSLPGFDEFLVSEIRPNERSGGFEVVALPRIGAAVSFTTGPSSAGRKFYEDRDAEARSRRQQQALARTFMGSIIPGSSKPEEQFDYDQQEQPDFKHDGSARVDEIADGGGYSGIPYTKEKREWAHGIRDRYGEGAEVVSETSDGALVVETSDGERITSEPYVPEHLRAQFESIGTEETHLGRLLSQMSTIGTTSDVLSTFEPMNLEQAIEFFFDED